MAEVRPSIKAGAEQPPALVTDGSVSRGGCACMRARADSCGGGGGGGGGCSCVSTLDGCSNVTVQCEKLKIYCSFQRTDRSSSFCRSQIPLVLYIQLAISQKRRRDGIFFFL